jgi:hypothetical protein
VARRLRDLSDDIDGLVASQLWVEASAAYRLNTSNVAGAIVGQAEREVLADLGVGDKARRRDRAMTVASGDPDLLLDEIPCTERELDPGPGSHRAFPHWVEGWRDQRARLLVVVGPRGRS